MSPRIPERSATQSAQGFTLVELAIVLFIVALLLAGLLGPLSTRIEQSARNDAARSLDEIKEALYGYAIVNGRLPCPDTDNPPDGVENRPAGVCATLGTNPAFAVGRLPYTDLAVAQQDPWGQFYAYGVTTTFADATDGADDATPPVSPTCSASPRPGISFELCSVANGGVLDAAAGANVVTNVPAVVIAYGANGATPMAELGADEQENQDGDATAVLRSYSQADGAEFDDMLVWIAPNILMNRMINAERLP